MDQPTIRRVLTRHGIREIPVVPELPAEPVAAPAAAKPVPKSQPELSPDELAEFAILTELIGQRITVQTRRGVA